MKYLYKYPHAEFPYRDLVDTNRGRSREEFEYELLDTGVFDTDRYFDVFVEYAKADPEDTLIRISVHNRGPEAAEIHILPTLWFRNTWTWDEGETKPVLGAIDQDKIHASHPQLGGYTLQCEGPGELLFTENESNAGRLWGQPSQSPYVKDAFHRYVISGETSAVNPSKTGTKAAAYYRLKVPAGGSRAIRLRLNVKASQMHSTHLIRSSQAALPMRTSSMSASLQRTLAKMSVASTVRPWLECCGPSSTTISIWIGGSPNMGRTQ